mgnify:CR=1 FL=1
MGSNKLPLLWQYSDSFRPWDGCFPSVLFVAHLYCCVKLPLQPLSYTLWTTRSPFLHFSLMCMVDLQLLIFRLFFGPQIRGYSAGNLFVPSCLQSTIFSLDPHCWEDYRSTLGHLRCLQAKQAWVPGANSMDPLSFLMHSLDIVQILSRSQVPVSRSSQHHDCWEMEAKLVCCGLLVQRFTFWRCE